MINSIIELVLDYWTPERKELWKEYEKTDKSIPWEEYERLRNGLVQSTAQKEELPAQAALPSISYRRLRQRQLTP